MQISINISKISVQIAKFNSFTFSHKSRPNSCLCLQITISLCFARFPFDKTVVQVANPASINRKEFNKSDLEL